MTEILFIVGVFLIWQGQMQLIKKMQPWPKEKKNGRIIGVIFLMPQIIMMLSVFVK